MSAQDMRRRVVIEVEIDPALSVNGSYSFPAHWRLRLLPCRGGVRLLTTSRVFNDTPHATPESLCAVLGNRALDCAIAAGECVPGSATWQYREDRMWFYLLAARAVREDPRILRLWGLA